MIIRMPSSGKNLLINLLLRAKKSNEWIDYLWQKNFHIYS